MLPLHPLSLIEQTMEHFREGFRNAHWRGTLARDPARHPLTRP